ncbi:hypothetical protein SAMN00768000_3789 [Sulfobacillus thermosulfidooxidans DSM 9293]|uniref:Uncharacterized protein n=1 Tax=Sulfobacillus thermosulfidooxidans (strain DSM 9293 / VKM B-1269 / AT-1) TaxID=929705 RepID=A0A1W1WPV6_SULTA|nr:hypothetical protein SAMN00768000_3789 [Sulfobacillus thermosulfidooxidans DSM 9293]
MFPQDNRVYLLAGASSLSGRSMQGIPPPYPIPLTSIPPA